MLLTLHITVASLWIGLVVGEAVMELAAKEPELRKFVAKAHEIMDLYFEAPFVVVTLVTGLLLLSLQWPNVSTLLAVKMILGLMAVIANLLCIRWVIKRSAAASKDEFTAWDQKIASTKYTIPFAVVALILGVIGV